MPGVLFRKCLCGERYKTCDIVFFQDQQYAVIHESRKDYQNDCFDKRQPPPLFIEAMHCNVEVHQTTRKNSITNIFIDGFSCWIFHEAGYYAIKRNENPNCGIKMHGKYGMIRRRKIFSTLVVEHI